MLAKNNIKLKSLYKFDNKSVNEVIYLDNYVVHYKNIYSGEFKKLSRGDFAARVVEEYESAYR